MAIFGLKLAIDQGEPFFLELKILQEIMPNDPAIPKLNDFAQDGIPTSLNILMRFPEVAEKMFSAIEVSETDQGIWKNMIFKLEKMIRVRLVGNVEGNTPDAIIARIEYKIRHGDLKGAAEEWDKLPEKAISTSIQLKKQLSARIYAEKLLKEELSRILQHNTIQG
ncbi:COG4223 family protein [Liberibacter crescens]|nr:hypothetical protein [Liberibacter crescens]